MKTFEEASSALCARAMQSAEVEVESGLGIIRDIQSSSFSNWVIAGILAEHVGDLPGDEKLETGIIRACKTAMAHGVRIGIEMEKP